MSLYGIDIPVFVTAYIKADTPERALEIARAMKQSEIRFSDFQMDGAPVPVTDRPFAETVAYYSLSFGEYGTMGDAGQDAVVEFKCTDDGEEPESDPATLTDLEVTFIGKAYIGGHPLEVDHARWSFKLYQSEVAEAREKHAHGLYLDFLATAINAPEVVREWAGPFEIVPGNWITD